VWVANRGDGTVTRLSARTGRAQGTPIRVGGAPAALAVTRDAVLVLDARSGAIVRIDPRTGRVTRPFDLGGSPGSIAVGAGAAWVVDARAGTVTRIAG
jgi:streptogramin lyase